MKFKKICRQLVLALLALGFLSGCGTVESVALSAAFGLAGQEGLDYFGTGNAREIIYVDIKDIESTTIAAFAHLAYRLEKKQLRSDDSVRFLGSTGENQEVSLEVTLSPVAAGITEVEVTARHNLVMPDTGACHQLMREITDHADRLPVEQVSSVEF